ncbi:MAG: hypothetical protein AAFQ82_17355 [Myxococcota bacterium]
MAPVLLQSRLVAWVRALVAVGIMVLASGCLLPPPIEPEAEFGNQAPRVIDSSIFPATVNVPIDLSTQCSQQDQTEPFFLDVFDADAQDTIYWRVFVDWSEDTLQFERFQTDIEQIDVLPSEAEDGRRTLRADILGSDARFQTGLNPLDRPHVIEFVISDRPFSDDPLTAREPVGSTAQTTLWQWTVRLNDEPCTLGGVP